MFNLSIFIYSFLILIVTSDKAVEEYNGINEFCIFISFINLLFLNMLHSLKRGKHLKKIMNIFKSETMCSKIYTTLG